MQTDPIADMLTRIRNGCHARKERVDIPNSKIKTKLAEILKQEGYITDFRHIQDKRQGILEIKLKYGEEQQPVICGIQKVSTPGVRRYFGSDDIPKIRNGMGVLIMSTSKGVMTDKEARKGRVGGEALVEIW